MYGNVVVTNKNQKRIIITLDKIKEDNIGIKLNTCT